MLDQRTGTPTRRSKICSRCGQAFDCAQGEPGCWCEGVALRRETLAEIRAVAQDCICPLCLSEWARRESEDTASAAGTGNSHKEDTVCAQALPALSGRWLGVAPPWGPGRP